MQAVEFMAQVGKPLDEWQALMVMDTFGLRDDGYWAAFEAAALVPRQNGKGGYTEAVELAGLFLFGDQVIMHSAHLFKTAKQSFQRLVDIIEGSDWLTKRVAKIVRARGDEEIQLTKRAGGGRLLCFSRSGGAGRGFTGDKTVFDECAYLTIEQYQAATPTLATVPNPQIIYTGTPPDEDVGPMPEDAMMPSVRRRGHKGGERIALWEWSPPEGYDRSDQRVHAMCNPSLGEAPPARIRPWFLLQQLENFTAAGRPEKFDTEHLGLWPPDPGEGWAEIPEQAWLDALDPQSAPQGTVAFAIAVSADRNWATVAAAGRRADGLRHVEVIKREQGTAWVVPWLTEIDNDVEVRDGLNRLKRWRPCAVVLAPGGPAGSLTAELMSARVDKLLRTPTDRQWGQASAAFFDGIAGRVGPDEEPRVVRDVRHRGQDELTDAARAGTKRKLGESWAWERYLETDIGPLEAATLALWGHATYSRKGVIDGPLMGGG